MSKKKRKTAPKMREESITLEFSRPVKVNSISFGPGNKFCMNEDGVKVTPKKITYDKSMPRDNKSSKKIVYSEIDDCNTNIYFILSGYDYVIGVDTNTMPTKYGEYSVSGVVGYRLIHSVEAVDAIELPALSGMVPRWCREQSRELMGVCMLINSIVSRKLFDYTPDIKILIVIDHNLDKIDRYNNREIPLIEGNEKFFLPEGMRLMYASADKKNDSWFNQIIYKCDKIAKSKIDEFMAQEEQWDNES